MMLKMLKPRVASMTLLCTMMFGGLPSAAQNTAAQGNNITVRYDKKSLQTLLDEVERQSGCLIREKVVTFRMVKLNLLLSIFCITK